MNATGSEPQADRPLFTWAAWLGLLVPVVAVGVFLAVNDPQNREQHWMFGVLTVVFGICFLCACVSLAGVRSNGLWVILPPAILGILLNIPLGLLSLFFWVLRLRSP